MSSRGTATRIGWAVGVVATGLAGVAAALLVGIATAGTFALQSTSATVTPAGASPVTESIVVTGGGRAVYTLSSESEHRQTCAQGNSCWRFWPPATTAARRPRAAPGIKGALTVWKHDGIRQLVLGGHPLFEFSGDASRDQANGDGVHSFHGVWHVIRTSRTSTPVQTTTTDTTTTPTYTYTTPTITYAGY